MDKDTVQSKGALPRNLDQNGEPLYSTPAFIKRVPISEPTGKMKISRLLPWLRSLLSKVYK